MFYIVKQMKVSESIFKPKELPFAAPRPCYLDFGPVALTDSDINHTQALMVVEYDCLYNRIDKFTSIDQLLSADMQSNPFLNMF